MAQLKTRNPGETQAVGAEIGRLLHDDDLISLSGPLGAGKTVLVRGLTEGRGGNGNTVHSPTFVFHHRYGNPARLHHIDLYRLGGGANLDFLDIPSLLDQAPVVIEWGENGNLHQYQPIEISIEITGDDERKISVLQDPRGRLAELKS